MPIAFNKIMPGEPMCISIKNVSEFYGYDFIQAYLIKMLTNDYVKITDIHSRINNKNELCVYVCFDRWFIQPGQTYTHEMSQMSDAFAHGFMYLIPAPFVYDNEFDNDWIIEYVDSVMKFDDLIMDLSGNEEVVHVEVYDADEEPEDNDDEKDDTEEGQHEKSEDEGDEEEEDADDEEEEEDKGEDDENEEEEEDEDKVYLLNRYLGIPIYIPTIPKDNYEMDNKMLQLLLMYWISLTVIFILLVILNNINHQTCK